MLAGISTARATLWRDGLKSDGSFEIFKAINKYIFDCATRIQTSKITGDIINIHHGAWRLMAVIVASRRLDYIHRPSAI